MSYDIVQCRVIYDVSVYLENPSHLYLSLYLPVLPVELKKEWRVNDILCSIWPERHKTKAARQKMKKMNLAAGNENSTLILVEH